MERSLKSGASSFIQIFLSKNYSKSLYRDDGKTARAARGTGGGTASRSARRLPDTRYNISTVKIALVQMDVHWEDREANLGLAGTLVEDAARRDADAALLPEMFTTGFSMNLRKHGEEGDGRTHSFLSGLARRLGINIVAGYGVMHPAEGKGRNIARAYDRTGEVAATYVKMHPFSFAGEDRHFEAGASPVLFPLDDVPSSVFICYDLRFPEAFRQVAREARLVFVIANWPASRDDHWVSLLKARAIENQCFVAGVNRAGTDGNGISYTGRSAVFGPSGETVCLCGGTEEVRLCTIEPPEAERIRSKYPFLKDMAERSPRNS